MLAEQEVGRSSDAPGEAPRDPAAVAGRFRLAQLPRMWSPRRSARSIRKRLPVFAGQLAVFVALALFWQFCVGRPGEPWVLVDEFYVGRPAKAWDAIVRWNSDGTLSRYTLVTLKEMLWGFAFGCLGGMAVGFVLGLNEYLAKVLTPFIAMANTVPKLALAPLLIMWFGFESASKIALSALLVFFIVFTNTFAGVRDVDQNLINVMRVMGAGRTRIHWQVTLPSALVWVVASLRLAVPYAFLGAVVGQMLAAQEGLGVLIARAGAQFNPSALMGAIVVLAVMAWFIDLFVTALERRLLRWKDASRA